MTANINHVRSLSCPNCSTEAVFYHDATTAPCAKCGTELKPAAFKVVLKVYTDGQTLQTSFLDVGEFPTLAQAVEEGRKAKKAHTWCEVVLTCNGSPVSPGTFHVREVYCNCCNPAEAVEFDATESGTKPCPVCYDELSPPPYQVFVKEDSPGYYGESYVGEEATLDAAIALGKKAYEGNYHYWGFEVSYGGHVIY